MKGKNTYFPFIKHGTSLSERQHIHNLIELNWGNLTWKEIPALFAKARAESTRANLMQPTLRANPQDATVSQRQNCAKSHMQSENI